MKFRKEQITSFSGVFFIFQYFKLQGFNQKLANCFHHINHKSVVGFRKIFFILVLHVMLGFRSLRELECYSKDPLLLRILSLRSFPCLSTITRNMSKADETSIKALRKLIREDILMKLAALELKIITIDFDGSVITSSKYAEGTAVGFNKKRRKEHEVIIHCFAL